VPRFGLAEKARKFTLAPRRLTLEQQVGKRVAGVARADEVT
jgi:hypothetical protein